MPKYHQNTRARHFLVVPSKRTRDKGHKHRVFHLNMRKKFCEGGRVMEQAAQRERVWSLLLLIYSKPAKTISFALLGNLLYQGLGLDYLQRFLPITKILRS